MLSRTFRPAIKCLAFVGLTALGAADAHAGFTTVVAPKHATELGHADILSQAYGGAFNANGVNYSNGSVTARRVEDSSSVVGMMDLLTDSGTSADQCWTNGVVSAHAIARFAGYEQSLGIVDGASGTGTFQELFSVTGLGMDVTGSVTGLDLCEKTFRFARSGGGDMFTSLDIDNMGGGDQMVSYHLTGPGRLDRFVLFFEDVGANLDSDWDFNDLVVEITAGPPNAVPLPPAVWSGLAVLLTGGLWNARTRVLRWFK